MRFHQFFLLAPALLAAAQLTSTQDSSSASASSTQDSTSQASSSASVASQSSSSDDDDDDSGNIITRTFGGGRATLLTNAGGNIIDTITNAQQLASTLRDNDNLGTVVSSVPLTTYTTSGPPTAIPSDGIVTTSFHGQATLITNEGGNIVGTVWGIGELVSTLRDNDNLGTVHSSVPPTTYTTSLPAAAQQTGNAAPAAAAPMMAGGVIGAGLMVVGLL